MLGLGVSHPHFVGRTLRDQNPAKAGPNHKAEPFAGKGTLLVGTRVMGLNCIAALMQFGMSAVTAAA